jgi:hypothetical protein
VSVIGNARKRSFRAAVNRSTLVKEGMAGGSIMPLALRRTFCCIVIGANSSRLLASRGSSNAETIVAESQKDKVEETGHKFDESRTKVGHKAD